MYFRNWIIIIVLQLLFSPHVLHSTVRGNPLNQFENQDPIIVQMIEHVEPGNLYNTVLHLQSFENRYSWDKQWLAAKWIEKSLNKDEIKTFIQTFNYESKSWPNVIATIEGTDNADQIIMLLAHFDSISDEADKEIAPGADDNASGVAVLMEIARILKKFPLKRTTMLCFLSNEERGRIGSEHAAQLFRKERADIKAVINLDVLGYRPRTISPFEALRAGYSLKIRAKIIYRAAQNLFSSLLNGSNAVKIGGRKENRRLVQTTARIFRQYADLNVKEIIDDKCK